MNEQPIKQNILFYADNLKVLREYISNESIDLIYLDPPFNSNRNYNVLFKDERGLESEAQIEAFEDTWHWNLIAQETYDRLITETTPDISKMIGALREFIGTNQMMAYLVMMCERLIELHRVLKPTGSLYLQCDTTASHYLKIILDTIFGPKNFKNEIIWRRYGTHNDVGQGSRHYGRIHDSILFYTKSNQPKWIQQFAPLDPAYIKETYRYIEPETGRRFTTTPLTGPGGAAKGNPVFEWKGHTRAWRYNRETMEKLDREGRLHYSKTGYVRQKLYLDESRGVPIQDIWNDIASLSGTYNERLGYPTQKPLALLERIIQASSEPGDLILDPFCGCGTAIAAAQKLDRKWIGIDITVLSIALQEYRLEAMFPGIAFKVEGLPEDLAGAKRLALQDRYQFQFWALTLIRAMPLGAQKDSKTGKKGSDKGIDGIIPFLDDNSGKPKRVIVQVKSGHVKPADIRDLVGTIQRENAAIGAFITLESPTKDMINEATSAGFYQTPGWVGGIKYPRIQILPIAELLHQTICLQVPSEQRTFKQATKITQTEIIQNEIFGGSEDDLEQ